MLVSERPRDIILEEIGKHFDLKEYLTGTPPKYLGGKIQNYEMENGQEFWVFGPTQYVQAPMKNDEEYLNKK